MRTLTPHLPFRAEETPLSFVARLARLHLGSRLMPFLNDIGVRPFDLRASIGDAIERVAAIAGADPAALRRNTPLLTGHQTYDLRGHAVTEWFLSNPMTVFCPACLAEDDAAGDGPFHSRVGRFIWTLRAVRTCPRHHIALKRREKKAWGDELHEYAERVPERDRALNALIEAAPRRKASPLQSYVLDRLDGACGPIWLDAQPIEQAQWVTEMLGAVLSFGTQIRPSELTVDQWDEAGRVGFAHVSEGEAGIRKALDTLMARAPSRAGKAGPQHVFGPLYTCIAAKRTKADRGDIRRIVREYIFDSFALADGATVLGAALPARRLHSVASLATEVQLDSRTLRAVLVNAGVVDHARRDDQTVVFDAEAGRRIAAAVMRRVTLLSLPKHLDCTRPLAEQIADERILPPLALGADEGAGRTGKAFDQRDVVRLLEELSAAAVAVRSEPVGFVSIAKAAEKAKLRAVEVLHLVLGAHLTAVVRVDGASGIAALRVDSDEVKHVAGALMTDLSPPAAFGALRIPVRSGWTLIDGVGDGIHLPHRRVAGANSRRSFVRVRREDIAAFADEFTTVVRIADAIGQTPGEVVYMLRAERISYCAKWRHLGVDLIRRSELPKTLAA